MTRATWVQGALSALLILGAGTTTAATAGPPTAQLAQAPSQMEAAYVRGVQKELLAHGYHPGPVDGIAGPQTRAAVRAYQRDAGLPVTGAADKRLLDHLKFALPKVYAFGQPVMGVVLDLQRELARRNYYLGPQDGRTGPATLDALHRFQEDAGLPQDDRIDSMLLQKVREAPAEVQAELGAQRYEALPREAEPQEYMEFVPPKKSEPQAAPQPEGPFEGQTKEKPDAEAAPDFSNT